MIGVRIVGGLPTKEGYLNICTNCQIEFPSSKRNKDPRKYCSNQCQQDFQYHSYIKKWKEGKEKGWNGKTVCLSRYIRRYLRETRGNSCESCGWDERHPSDGSVLTEIDHIDGNAKNCDEDNLRILCPNCHSLTPTYRARNKSSSRIR